MGIAASSSSDNGSFVDFLFVLYAIAYLIPTIVAIARRRVVNMGSVVVVNFFLGWTVIGWIVALAMAVRSRPQQQAYMQPPSGWSPAPPPSPPGPPSDLTGYR